MLNYKKSIKYYGEYCTRKDKSPFKKRLKYGRRSKSWLKKYSNIKVRRYKNIPQNSGYKKVLDLWWILF